MEIDDDLIAALHEDGRVSVQDLARRLGRPRAAVAGRLRAILDEGVLRVAAMVDPALSGQHVIGHLSLHVSTRVEPVAASLRAMDETVLVSAIGGAHDIVSEVRASSTAALQDSIARIRAIPGIAGVNTLVYTDVVKGFFVSRYRGEVLIDDLDTAIIERLQADGRMSYRALGDAVRLSPSAVATRVRRLLEGGVMTIAAVEARSLARRQLSMGVGLVLNDDGDAALAALSARPEVDFATRTIGRFDAVVTLVQPSAGGLHAALERVRELAGVERIETWTHLSVTKEDYARSLRPVIATL
ncbi:Lrp/AsnC family transcriptional regulator [Microbacterium azadirachtae]|uniref:Regulatory protein AsnC n=1 Tax=Microbacterium azadirachtae TaxID=582680 RepID=A0A0F0LLX9_9MICO|nr:Lrp/AsnC family transcriptional regulator [Microbacterium azadirachtae]KJL34168.1 Regulatory protein AsnC [Microbacterium azadirachtae]